MNVGGSIYLNSGVAVSVYVYSAYDNSYKVHSQSGFGCHLLNSRIGFDAKAPSTQTFGKGWNRVLSWDPTPKKNTGLYSLGGGVAKNGYYTVPETGYYMCNAMVRMDEASKASYFRLNIAINGDRSSRGGTFESKLSSRNIFGFKFIE